MTGFAGFGALKTQHVSQGRLALRGGGGPVCRADPTDPSPRRRRFQARRTKVRTLFITGPQATTAVYPPALTIAAPPSYQAYVAAVGPRIPTPPLPCPTVAGRVDASEPYQTFHQSVRYRGPTACPAVRRLTTLVGISISPRCGPKRAFLLWLSLGPTAGVRGDRRCPVPA